MSQRGRLLRRLVQRLVPRLVHYGWTLARVLVVFGAAMGPNGPPPPPPPPPAITARERSVEGPVDEAPP